MLILTSFFSPAITIKQINAHNPRKVGEIKLHLGNSRRCTRFNRRSNFRCICNSGPVKWNYNARASLITGFNGICLQLRNWAFEFQFGFQQELSRGIVEFKALAKRIPASRLAFNFRFVWPPTCYGLRGLWLVLTLVELKSVPSWRKLFYHFATQCKPTPVNRKQLECVKFTAFCNLRELRADLLIRLATHRNSARKFWFCKGTWNRIDLPFGEGLAISLVSDYFTAVKGVSKQIEVNLR